MWPWSEDEEVPLWQEFKTPRSSATGSSLSSPAPLAADEPLWSQFKKPKQPKLPGEQGADPSLQGPPEPNVQLANQEREVGRLTVERSKLAQDPSKAKELNANISATNALQALQAAGLDTAIERGQRPGAWDRFGPQFGEQTAGMLKGFRTATEIANPALWLLRKVMGGEDELPGIQEELGKEVAALPPAVGRETLIDFSGTVGPHALMGLATGPVQGAVEGGLAAKGVGPLASRGLAALAQEGVLAPGTIGASKTPAEAAMYMAAGAIGGFATGGGARRLAGSIDELPSIRETGIADAAGQAYRDVEEIVDPASVWKQTFPAVESQNAGKNAFINQPKPHDAETIQAILDEAVPFSGRAGEADEILRELEAARAPREAGPVPEIPRSPVIGGEMDEAGAVIQAQNMLRGIAGDTPHGRALKESMDLPVELQGDAPHMGAYAGIPKGEYEAPRHKVNMGTQRPKEARHVAAHELGHGYLSGLDDTGWARFEGAKTFQDTPVNRQAAAQEAINKFKQAQRDLEGGGPEAQALLGDVKAEMDRRVAAALEADNTGLGMQIWDAVQEADYLQGGALKGRNMGVHGSQHTSQELMTETIARYAAGDPDLSPNVKSKLDKLFKGSQPDSGTKMPTPGMRGEEPIPTPPSKQYQDWINEAGPRRVPERVEGEAFPKATAGETNPAGLKTNIRLDKFEDADAAVEKEVRQVIESQASVNAGAVDEARRGIITDAETERAGQLMGADADQMKRILGQGNDVALNEKELRALGNVLDSSSKRVVEASKKLNPGDAASVKEFVDAAKLQFAAQMRAHGAWATAGRSLRALKSPFKGLTEESFQRLASALEEPAKVDALVREIAAGGNAPELASGMIRNAGKIDFWDKLFEYRISNMLSLGFGTARNVLSNTAMAAKLAEEQFTGAGVDTILSGGGLLRPREKTFRGATRSIGAGVKQIFKRNKVNSLDSAGKIFWKSLKSEGSEFKDYAASRGIQSAGGKLQETRAIGGLKGKVLRHGINVMNASDQFNKTALYATRLEELVFEKARNAGKLNDNAYISSLYTDKQLVNDASRYADAGTFTDRDSAVVKMANSLRNVPGMRWLLPFATTTTNVLRQASARLPVVGFGVAAKDIAMGARGRAASEAIAKPIIPTALALYLGSKVMNGTITGGKPTAISSDRGYEQLPRAAGWQPYSTKVGDKYYSYQAIAPLGTVLGAIVDFAQASQSENKSAIAAATKSLTNTIQQHILGESTIRELYEQLAAVNETGERKEESAGTSIGQFASGFVPFSATLGAVARGTDDTPRDTVARGGSVGETAARQIASGIPGLRETLPTKKDTFDREMKGMSTSGMLRSSKVNEAELKDLMKAEELAGWKRTLPAQGKRNEYTSAEDALQAAKSARKYLEKTDLPRDTKVERLSLRDTRPMPDNQAARERYALKERLYKTELNLAIEAGNKDAFKAAWKDAAKSGFNFASGNPRDYWARYIEGAREN